MSVLACVLFRGLCERLFKYCSWKPIKFQKFYPVEKGSEEYLE
jgi:hypothetical protein